MNLSRLRTVLLPVPALCLAALTALTSTPCASQAVSPRSLAGDWECEINGPTLKLVLHLSVDASGALAGSIDTPDSPPKHIELTGVSLSGNTLSYTMPGMGKMYEVVMPGGAKMSGPYIWERARTTTVPAAVLAGDWEWEIGGPNKAVLHLRAAADGTLTGTLDMNFGGTANRQNLTDVKLAGDTLTYAMPNGGGFKGELSKDEQSIVGNASGSATVISWQRARSAGAALAADARVKAMPTDGTWSGVIRRDRWTGIGAPDGSALHVTLHFSSDPLSCSIDSPEQGGAKGIPCQMTLAGNKVHVSSRSLQASFDGVLSSDRQHLAGTWTVGPPWNWGAMELGLVRTAPASN